MQTRDTVVGVFEDAGDAERALDALKAAGFRPDDVGVVARDRRDASATGRDAGATERDAPSQADGDPTGGLLAGGMIGGVAGWLIGAATLAAPGIGALYAAGALAAAVSGAGVGAAAGGLIAALAGAGVPEHEAAWYQERVHGGAILLTVRARERYDEARAILERHGGRGYSADAGGRAPIL